MINSGAKKSALCVAAKNYIVKIEEGQPSPINLAIVLDGGLVQAVVTDAPEAFKGVNTMIIDYDTDYLEKDDERLGIVPQGVGTLKSAYIWSTSVEQSGIDLGAPQTLSLTRLTVPTRNASPFAAIILAKIVGIATRMVSAASTRISAWPGNITQRPIRFLEANPYP